MKWLEKAYSFIPDSSQSILSNALGVLGNTPTEYYFSSPQNYALYQAIDLLDQRELEPQLVPVLVQLHSFVMEAGPQSCLHVAEGTFDVLPRQCADRYAAARVRRLVKSTPVMTTDLPLVCRDVVEGFQRGSKSMDGQEAQELTTVGAGPRGALE